MALDLPPRLYRFHLNTFPSASAAMMNDPLDMEIGAGIPEAQADRSICPLCLVGMREKLRGIVSEVTGERFGIDECSSCGLGRTWPVPGDMVPYYDATYYGGRHGLTAKFCNRRRLRILRRIARSQAGRCLLDFGCGDGGFLLEAIEQGWDGLGIERDWPGSTLDDPKIVANLDELGEGARFDCLTFWHTLEHLEDPIGVLTSLRERMSPGGVVVAAVPNFGSWQSRALGASWIHLDLPRHLSHFTAKSLSKTFQASGFRVEDISYGELEYDVIGWSQGFLNHYLGGRNEFFKVVSGRPVWGSTGLAAFHLATGLSFSMLSILPAWVESRIGRGGTLVARAYCA